MTRRTESLSEIDLCAYVDGQLDTAHRLEVEDYLSRNPAAAAAVMCDLRDRAALRLVLDAPASARQDAIALARQLDRKLVVGKVTRVLRRASLGVLVLLCLLLAQDELREAFTSSASQAIPSFAEEALDAHNAARMRFALPSETKDRSVDAAAVRRAAKIVFPQPSPEWRIIDSRLVPSDQGPGVEIAFDSGDGVPVTFFGVRTRDRASFLPVAAQRGGDTVAYWRRGHFGYALTADLAPAHLMRLASDMADNPPADS